MNNHPSAKANLKIHYPCRDQYEMRYDCLDDRLPANHKARKIWDFVQCMDTNPCYMEIKTSIGCVGRMATDPNVLFALWLYGYSEGVTSGREIVRLVEEHDAYRWIAGGVGVNRSNINDFRSVNLLKFQELLTNSITVLVRAGLLKEEDFGQDGTRVKSAAGFSSYRKEEKLDQLFEQASKYVKEVEGLNSQKISKIALSAKKRAAREREELLIEAKKELEKHQDNLQINAKKSRRKQPSEKKISDVRASYADPSARKMKMGDGGFRLAHNIQFVTGVDSMVIYGVGVSNTLDPGTMGSMINQVKTRLRKLGLPMLKNIIADSAYSGKNDLEEIARRFPEVTVYAPPKAAVGDPKKHKRGDSPAVKTWRDRIDTEEHREKYSQRSRACEFPNMITKNKGMVKFLVRGTSKVLMASILHAIVYNISRFWDLSKKTTTLV
jgi:transposase